MAMCCGLMNPPFKMFLEITDNVISSPRRNRSFPIVTNAKLKIHHLSCYESVLVPVTWVTCKAKVMNKLDG